MVTPPATIGRRRSTSASPTAAAMPTSDAPRATWAPRWYGPATLSTPTSSASHASSAPLLNVQPKPITAAAISTTATPGASPVATKVRPMITAPMTIDARLL